MRARFVLAAAAVLVAFVTVVAAASGAQSRWSSDVYRSLVGWAVPTSVWAIVSQGTVLALVMAFLGCLLQTWRRRVTFARGVAAGIGTVVAYGSSELVKSAYAEVRPCRVVLVSPDCPAAGDWSFPSNHTVIAFALAAACALLVVRTAVPVFAVAAVMGFSRIAEGVHYPHDVLAGAALGVGVVVAVTLIGEPVVAAALGRRGPGRSRSAEPV